MLNILCTSAVNAKDSRSLLTCHPFSCEWESTEEKKLAAD